MDHHICVLRLLWLLSATLMPSIGFSHEAPPGWLEVAAPTDRMQLRCANFSNAPSAVDISSDEKTVLIRKYQRDQTRLALDLPGGRMIGTNGGEFGGKIEWQPTGSTVRHKVLEEQDGPFALFKAGGEVFGAVGYRHGSSDRGRLLKLSPKADSWLAKLSRKSGPWKVERDIDLGAAPLAVDPRRYGSILIVTGNAVMEVNGQSMKAKIVFRNENWRFLNANSIVRTSSDTIFIGMQRGVSRLTVTKTGYEEKWWVPASCPSMIRKEPAAECECENK